MDLEARAHSEHPDELRLWLRLLTCAQQIERQVRGRLREQFDTTLPRFDLMAQLERAPEGLKMNELSRRMMVTGGNVTGITDQQNLQSCKIQFRDFDPDLLNLCQHIVLHQRPALAGPERKGSLSRNRALMKLSIVAL